MASMSQISNSLNCNLNFNSYIWLAAAMLNNDDLDPSLVEERSELATNVG